MPEPTVPNPNRTRRGWRLLGLVLGLAFHALLGWRIYEKVTAVEAEKKSEGVAVPVQLASVERREMRDLRVFTGTLRAESTVIIAPKIAGRLETLTVHIGDAVKNGQLLATLDDAEIVQQVAQAKAELEVMRARCEQCRPQLALTEREFNRVKELKEKKIASLAEFDSVESALKTQAAELRVLQAQAAQTEAALRTAEVRLGYTRIHVTWEGETEERFVGERFVDQGEMLTPNDPILSLVDLATLRAVITVIERDYPLLQIGQTATLRVDAFPGEVFTGTVNRVAQVLKESSRQAQVEVKIPNANRRLKPGMFARVQIELARKENATVIPRAALVQHRGAEGVFLHVPDDKSVKFIPITEGIDGGAFVEVLDPPLSGQVVILGQHLLRDGAKVALPQTDLPPKE